ncbi:PorP/SprF family type IX secretion system membrane protein [Spirosoma montaniterrae]|nr:PorP/SprF family type IX secretion system membrane protein [Spirosoma montaniterrae]
MKGKLVFILLFISQCAIAQREVLYSQYLVNPLGINPAYAGSRETFHLTALLRRKWFGVRGAPITQTVSIDGTVAKGQIGLGFQALNDRMGFYQATGFYGSAAYRFNLPALAKLSVGIQAGVSVLPFLNINSSSPLNQTVSSFGVGLYYRSDRLFAGISAPELAGQQIGLGVQSFNVRPVMMQVGAPINVGENTRLIPSVMVSKIKDRPVGFDLNLRAWFNQQIGLGISYRQNSPGLVQTNYLQALAEVQVSKSIRLGYIFNSQTPENPNATLYFQPSVHEVMLRFSPNTLTFTE